MDTECYMGENSSEFVEWCRRNYGAKKKLRINSQCIDCSPDPTGFSVNGTEYGKEHFGTDLEYAKDTVLSVVLAGDSGSHVFSIDGQEIAGHPITCFMDPFTLSADRTMEVVFKQDWI